jgi:F-type H+-transporting ATPase subunit b
MVILASGGPLLKDPTFWVAMSFLGFVGLLVFLGVPRLVAGVLDERASGIQKELDEARRLKEEAQKLLEDYKQKHAAAEAEARSIIESARKEADNLAAETRKSMKENVERRTRNAEEKIARAEAQALADVRAAAVEAAVAAAEKILAEKTAGANAAAATDRSIKEIKGRLN